MKQHYEKIIVACCFLSLFINIGLNSTAFAVYQPFIVALPGLGDSAGSFIVSTRVLVSVVATLFVNRFYELLDVRVGLSLATALTGGAFLVYSFASTLPAFLAGAALAGVAYGLGGLVATATLVNRWFKSGIGTAVGTASVGSGVAGFVIPVAATNVIEGNSLMAAFAAEAVLSFALAALIFVFLRNRPADVGLDRYESKAAESGRGKEQAERISHGIELSRGRRMLVLVAMAMLGGFSMTAIAYLSVLFVSSGFDVHFAAVLLSVAGVCLTVAKFLVGEMFDRMGTPLASFVMFIVMAAGLVMCCFAQSGIVALAIGAALCTGAGLSLGSVGLSVWSIELSSPQMRARSIKNCQVAYSVGGFVMNIVPGPLKELTGTYVSAYAIMLALAIAAAFIILGTYRRVDKASGK